MTTDIIFSPTTSLSFWYWDWVGCRRMCTSIPQPDSFLCNGHVFPSWRGRVSTQPGRRGGRVFPGPQPSPICCCLSSLKEDLGTGILVQFSDPSDFGPPGRCAEHSPSTGELDQLSPLPAGSPVQPESDSGGHRPGAACVCCRAPTGTGCRTALGSRHCPLSIRAILTGRWYSHPESGAFCGRNPSPQSGSVWRGEAVPHKYLPSTL